MQKKNWMGYFLIFPAFLVIFAVIIYPLISAIVLSFHKFILIRPDLGMPFIGLDNYSSAILNPVFLNAIKNTIIWVGINLAIQLVLGMLIALILNEEFFGRALARGGMLIPWITPSVVAVLVWRWMYDAQFGIFNAVLINLGLIEKGIAWLGNTNTAMLAVLIESIWKGTPFVMLMLLAALQVVPQELKDASKVDGAGSLATFWYVTLPLIMPTVIIAATLTIIYTFNNFNSIWLMTEGGPLRATETLTILVYTRGFRDFNFGEAAAIGVVTLLILLLFVFIFGRRYLRSEIDL
jgi:multiple sugar transport system permease protein